jgi:hypothetical protein
MLYWFTGGAPGYQAWLAGNPAGFVVAVGQVVRVSDIPLRADGSRNMAGFPRMHPVMHRAECEATRSLGADYTKICGTRAELQDSFGPGEMETCPSCL